MGGWILNPLWFLLLTITLYHFRAFFLRSTYVYMCVIKQMILIWHWVFKLFMFENQETQFSLSLSFISIFLSLTLSALLHLNLPCPALYTHTLTSWSSAQHFTNIMKAVIWFNESDNCNTSWDFTTLCIFAIDIPSTDSKAVGSFLQRCHHVAFAVSRSVFRHDIALSLMNHINLSSLRRHSTISCVVKSSWKYTCFITIPNVLKQEENSGENPPPQKKNWGGKKRMKSRIL